MNADHLRPQLDKVHSDLSVDPVKLDEASRARLLSQDLRSMLLDTFLSVDTSYHGIRGLIMSSEDMILANTYAHEETLRRWAELHGVNLNA